MKPLRTLFGMLFVAGLGYLAVSVPIGDKTLWQRVQDRIGLGQGKGAPSRTAVLDPSKTPPLDKVDNDDRERLRQLIHSKLKD